MERTRLKAILSIATALTFVAGVAGCAANARTKLAASKNASPLGDSRQLVLVLAEDWDATVAVLWCYARPGPGQAWRAVGKQVPVNIGRTGLAWGRGLHGNPASPNASAAAAPSADHFDLPPGPTKREGDGKAPAGVFELPFAFGYAGSEQAGAIKLPYLALTANVAGVDDVKSKHYNRLVRTDQVAKDWASAEQMRRDDGLYEWGVFVNHNTSPTLPGAGSCIFLHVWRGQGKPTAGCTAMSRQEMIRLLQWLNPKARPVLVQLPRAAYDRLATRWALPAPRFSGTQLQQ